jgi:hypothetical protein
MHCAVPPAPYHPCRPLAYQPHGSRPALPSLPPSLYSVSVLSAVRCATYLPTYHGWLSCPVLSCPVLSCPVLSLLRCPLSAVHCLSVCPSVRLSCLSCPALMRLAHRIRMASFDCLCKSLLIKITSYNSTRR